MKNLNNMILVVFTALAVSVNVTMALITMLKPELIPYPMVLNIIWIVSLIYIILFVYANCTKKKSNKATKCSKIRKINYDNKIVVLK